MCDLTGSRLMGYRRNAEMLVRIALETLADVIDLDRLRRRDLLGGLIHEYQLAA
jgi:hypothetical protein